jgi:septal ring factor EnvC (AmiA/AmiB activator)
MKKIIINNKLLFFLVIFLSVPLSYYCRNSFAAFKSNINTRLKYRSVIKRLTFYKKELSLISSKISRRDSAVSSLKKKIRKDEKHIKKIKKKINKYGLLIKDLTEKIFIIHKEYRLDGIISFKDDSNAFIINYQLKILLKKEERKLLHLVKRKNKFLHLKKYLKNEKNSLVADINSIKRSKKRLKQLITGLNMYMKSLKINNDKNYNGYLSKKPGNMRRDNKKNRLLKRKVIKLIKNLKNKSRSSGIIFQVIK